MFPSLQSERRHQCACSTATKILCTVILCVIFIACHLYTQCTYCVFSFHSLQCERRRRCMCSTARDSGAPLIQPSSPKAKEMMIFEIQSPLSARLESSLARLSARCVCVCMCVCVWLCASARQYMCICAAARQCMCVCAYLYRVCVQIYMYRVCVQIYTRKRM